MKKIRVPTMYNRNLLSICSHVIFCLRQSFRFSRRIRLRTTRAQSANCQSNPIGIANVSAKPKNLRTLTRN